MSEAYFLTICLSPALQKTIVLPHLEEGEVNRSSEYYFDAAGKGINVSRILVQLGHPVVHLTQWGGRNKQLLKEMAEGDHIRVEWVESHSELRYCYTLLNTEKHTTTEIVEEVQPVEEGTESRLEEKYAELVGDSHTVIISGKRAAGYSDHLVPSLVEQARAHDKRVILDVRHEDLLNSLVYRPDIIKPNLSEFYTTFFGRKPQKENVEDREIIEQVKEKMLSLYREYSTIPILTRGKLETLYLEEGEVKSLKPEIITPVNILGSGDATTAGIASALAQGRSVTEMVAAGHRTARENALNIRPGSVK
jgi:1-phosphofructokinase family hexose kinase